MTENIWLCKVAYLYGQISPYPLKKGNSVLKIDRGGDQDVYLYNVKIGNFPVRIWVI